MKIQAAFSDPLAQPLYTTIRQMVADAEGVALKVTLLTGHEVVMHGFQDGTRINVYPTHLEGEGPDDEIFIIVLSAVAMIVPLPNCH